MPRKTKKTQKPKPARRPKPRKPVVHHPACKAEWRFVKHCRKWLRMVGELDRRARGELRGARVVYTRGCDTDRHRVRVGFYEARGLDADRWLDALDRESDLFAALPDRERAAGLRVYAEQFSETVIF